VNVLHYMKRCVDRILRPQVSSVLVEQASGTDGLLLPVTAVDWRPKAAAQGGRTGSAVLSMETHVGALHAREFECKAQLRAVDGKAQRERPRYPIALDARVA
jgi:hypothetical protein